MSRRSCLPTIERVRCHARHPCRAVTRSPRKEYNDQQMIHSSDHPKPRRWSFRALIFGVWTLMALLRATQVSLGFEMMGHVPSWWRLAIWQLLVFYVWIVLTPVILWLGRRVKFERSHWLRSLSLHLLCGSLITLFYLAIYTCLTRLLQIYPRWP